MNPDSHQLERTLQGAVIHTNWENAYRTPENARYYDMAIQYIADSLESSDTLSLLDAGCGICDYSLRLAKRNFKITAVDFSESVLKRAADNIKAQGFQDKISLQRENLLALSFADETYDCILCWGVLMHIPEVRQAMAELVRVLKPGGTLVISESNMDSIESRLLSGIKRFLGIQKAQVVETDSGKEHWVSGSFGKLVSRQANVNWMIEQFAAMGLLVEKQVAGQFTELYNRFSSKSIIGKAIHRFNRFWFKNIRLAGPAFGNILFFRKQHSCSSVSFLSQETVRK